MADSTHTNLSLLTDAELLRHAYNLVAPTELEMDLARRLEMQLDYEDELLEIIAQLKLGAS